MDEGCGRWEGDDCDRRREAVVVGSDGSNSILVFNKSLCCNGHATRAFVKYKNMWLEEVGSDGQGVVVRAVAVDAAIDAMVVNVRGGLRCARWQLVLRGEWHSILFECL